MSADASEVSHSQQVEVMADEPSVVAVEER
jgi:hypothetical protein